MNILFDMETNDPDDMMTLCWLASHPKIKLRGLTVMPGTPAQLGLIKKVLELTAHEPIPIGSWNFEHEKDCVSKVHFDWLGAAIEGVKSHGPGFELISELIAAYPDLQIITGAPLKNFKEIASSMKLTRWVAQGGFAGDNVVPEAYRLEKFAGRITCPTFNFNGDYKTALAMLENPNIEEKRLVSKNVCHGMVYDQDWQERIYPHRHQSAGLELIYKGMELYLAKSPNGKKFHDPLAAVVAVNPEVCEFREVRMFRQKGEWGAELCEGTNTFISVKANLDKFFEVFLG